MDEPNVQLGTVRDRIGLEAENVDLRAKLEAAEGRIEELRNLLFCEPMIPADHPEAPDHPANAR
jgi:hypothetical protein